jgi:hypothetical protein
MRHARQRQSQVCGVHGRASPGFGQQLHLQPLSNPHPGWRLISPGRRVVRRVTRCHRPWPGCRAPTNPPSRQTRPSRSRMRSSTVLPDGRGCLARSGYGQRPQGATAGASLTTGFSPGRRGRPRAVPSGCALPCSGWLACSWASRPAPRGPPRGRCGMPQLRALAWPQEGPRRPVGGPARGLTASGSGGDRRASFGTGNPHCFGGPLHPPEGHEPHAAGSSALDLSERPLAMPHPLRRALPTRPGVS